MKFFVGIWEARKASDGSNLQSPRRISRQFIQEGGPDEVKYTLMLTTWGQFITHDLTQASKYTTGNIPNVNYYRLKFTKKSYL